MASGASEAEETRDSYRWNESSKVYTRRIRNKPNGGSSQGGERKCNGSAVENRNGLIGSKAGDGDIALAGDGMAILSGNGIGAMLAKANGNGPRNGYGTSSKYGGDPVAGNGDVSAASRVDTSIPNNGKSCRDNGDTSAICDKAVVENGVAAVTNNSEDIVRDSGDAAVRDSGDAAVRDSGDAAVKDSGDAAVKDSGDAALRDRGDTAVKDSSDAAVRDSGDAAVKDSGDAAVRDDGDVVRDNGDAVVRDDGDAGARTIVHAAVSDNGDIAVADNGDSADVPVANTGEVAFSDTGETTMADNVDGAVADNVDSAMVDTAMADNSDIAKAGTDDTSRGDYVDTTMVDGDTVVADSGDTAMVDNVDTSVAGNGNSPAHDDGDTAMADNSKIDNLETAATDSDDTVMADSCDTSVADNDDTAVVGDTSAMGNQKTDNPETAVADIGKTALGNNEDFAKADHGDTAKANDTDLVTADAGKSDTGDTLDADHGGILVAGNGGDTLAADNCEPLVVDNSDSLAADNVDTAMTDHGHSAMANDGDSAMALDIVAAVTTDSVAAVVNDGDAATMVESGSSQHSEPPEIRDTNLLQLDLQEHHSSPLPQQLQEDGQPGQQLQEGRHSPQQLQHSEVQQQQQEVSSPQQQQEVSSSQQQQESSSPQHQHLGSSPQHQHVGSSPQHQHVGSSLQHQLLSQQQHVGSSPLQQHVGSSSEQQLDGLVQHELQENRELVHQPEDGRSAQQLHAPVEVDSDDTLSSNRMKVGVRGGFVGGKEIEAMRPIATRVDDRVNIDLVVARSAKQEARGLKRKLEAELDEVRHLAKKLKEKEVQISAYSIAVDVNGAAGSGVVGVSGDGVKYGGYGNVQYPANHGVEKGSGIRINHPSLVGVDSMKTSRPLTVSVMDHSLGVGEAMDKEKRTPKANQFYPNSDFILGKDKLPPAESNKKSKSGSSKKMNYGLGMGKQIIKNCNSLVQKLMKHTYGWVFNKPVDVKALNLHDYFDIIKQPMDLGTVKTRLNRNWYKSPGEFAEDVRLTFRNAMTYNPKGHDVHSMAEELLRLFEEKFVDIDAKYQRLRYDLAREMGLLTPTPRMAPSVMPAQATGLLTPTPRMAPSVMPAQATFPTMPVSLAAPLLNPPPVQQEMRTLERSASTTAVPTRLVYHAPVGRTPALQKPKAKDPDKRPMTNEEKQKLSNNLQNLPPEKLGNIVHIIKRNRSSAVSQLDDEEVEVDIDSIDNETLWELDRFVSNYKKSLSKYRRRAELAQQRAEAARALQEANRVATQVEPPREATTDQEKSTAPPAVNSEKQPDNASQSSSSSSSSSSSGSSSSDSDSSSSSDSSSDEGN